MSRSDAPARIGDCLTGLQGGSCLDLHEPVPDNQIPLSRVKI